MKRGTKIILILIGIIFLIIIFWKLIIFPYREVIIDTRIIGWDSSGTKLLFQIQEVKQRVSYICIDTCLAEITSDKNHIFLYDLNSNKVKEITSLEEDEKRVSYRKFKYHGVGWIDEENFLVRQTIGHPSSGLKTKYHLVNINGDIWPFEINWDDDFIETIFSPKLFRIKINFLENINYSGQNGEIEIFKSLVNENGLILCDRNSIFSSNKAYLIDKEFNILQVIERGCSGYEDNRPASSIGFSPIDNRFIYAYGLNLEYTPPTFKRNTSLTIQESSNMSVIAFRPESFKEIFNSKDNLGIGTYKKDAEYLYSKAIIFELPQNSRGILFYPLKLKIDETPKDLI